MNDNELTHLWNEKVRVSENGRDGGSLMNEVHSRINSEYVYNYKHNPNSVAPLSEK
jgi:hypothetical protein